MNDMKRLLIIDDEVSLRKTIALSFSHDIYTIAEASSVDEALLKVKEFHPNIIILDLGLPGKSGLEFLKEIRQWTQTPVIVLTAANDDQTKVKLLDSGADDYLTKPFSTPELVARVRVALRHAGQVEATPVFISNDLRVDINQRKVWVSDLEVKLTKTEFELLQRLVRDSGKVVSQNKLLKEIWGVQSQDESHYLRIYIKQLRKKIEKQPANPVHILTEPGVGYRII